jgi:hypothetical protein
MPAGTSGRFGRDAETSVAGACLRYTDLAVLGVAGANVAPLAYFLLLAV